MLHHTTAASLCGKPFRLPLLNGPGKTSQCKVYASIGTGSTATREGQRCAANGGDEMSRRPVLSLLGMAAVAEMVDVQLGSALAMEEGEQPGPQNVSTFTLVFKLGVRRETCWRSLWTGG